MTLLNIDMVQGFFDADGSFEAKVYLGTQKPISFHVNIIFSQKETDVLQAVLDTTAAHNSKGNSLKKISARTIINLSGTQSIGNSISIAFSSNAGQNLLEVWKTQPPKAPTKFLDYSIAKILAEVSETQDSTAVGVVKKHLPNIVLQDEKVAGLALLWLRFRMYGKTKDSRNPNLKPITSYYTELGVSQHQIDQSITIGKQLYVGIEKALAMHIANLTITDDYLVGYHIGDGSFSIQNIFEVKSFKAKFSWTVTDCAENLPLLKAIGSELKSKGVQFVGLSGYTTYFKLRVSSIDGNQKLVNLWKGKILPQVRKNQYECFSKAIEIYTLPNFRNDLSLLEEFIRLTWRMNPGTTSKRAGSLEDDLVKIQHWFNNRN